MIDNQINQMNHSAKIVSAILYEHALAAILAVVIHAMKREQSLILAVSAILAVLKCRTRHLACYPRENRGHENHRDRYRAHWYRVIHLV